MTIRFGKFLTASIMLITAMNVRADYQSTVLADNPLVYYALNPGANNSGNPGDPYTEPDLSSNEVAGSAFNMLPAAGPSAFITNAAAFDGSDSAVDLSDGSDLMNFTGPITIEAWVKNDSSSWFGDIVGKGYDTSQNYNEITLRVNGPSGANYYGFSGTAGVNGGVQSTAWAHVVVSCDGTNLSLYQNGILVQRTRNTSGSIIFTDTYRIGTGSADGTSRYFKGNLSQVAIYNHGLTAMQVQTHYNIGMFGTTNVAPLSSKSLKWAATTSSGNWDINTTSDWLNLANSQSSVFTNADEVLFDDSFTATSAYIAGVVLTYGLTVSNTANNYNLNNNGGALCVSGPFVKNGSGSVSFNVGTIITGPTTINGGVVVAGNNALANSSLITITNSSTMDFNGSSAPNFTPVIVSGGGVNGEGAIYNSGGAQYSQVLEITLAGDTTFGEANGNSRWDLGNGSSLSGAHKITINFPSGYGEWDTVNIAPNVTDMELAAGSWGLKGLGNGIGDPTKTLTVDSGTSLTVWNSNFGSNSGYNKNLHVLNGGGFAVRTSPDTFFNANVTLENNAEWDYFNGGGSTGQTMNGTYTLNGIAHMLIGDSTVTFANAISGPGGFLWDAYNNHVVFAAVNTYTGPTVIGGGLSLFLAGNGSISQSSLIFFGGNTPGNVSLDVSSRSDQTLTLASGQTLGGVGTINGNLTVSSGATIVPAGTNNILGRTPGNSSTGTLIATGDIALNGTTTIKLNGSGISDVIQAGGALTYGGTLNLVNIGAPFAVGNSFQIFSAGTFNSSAFSIITPASPGSGFAWDTSQLDSGKLNVIAASVPPLISMFTISSGKFIFSGTGGMTNGNYAVQINTNLASTNWTSIATNIFGADGSFQVTNPIGGGTNQLFFRIKQLP